MLLVVVGYHLVLDGPHVLRCVLSNIRCYMQSIYLSLSIYLSIYLTLLFSASLLYVS